MKMVYWHTRTCFSYKHCRKDTNQLLLSVWVVHKAKKTNSKVWKCQKDIDNGILWCNSLTNNLVDDNVMFILANDDDSISIFPSEIRKVPKSLEDVVRTTKFSKSEIRLLYKGFKQVCWMTRSSLMYALVFE